MHAKKYYTCFATLTTARTTSPYNTQLHYYSTCRKITFSVPWAGEKHVFLGLSRDCHNSVEHRVHYIFSPLLRCMRDMRSYLDSDAVGGQLELVVQVRPSVVVAPINAAGRTTDVKFVKSAVR